MSRVARATRSSKTRCIVNATQLQDAVSTKVEVKGTCDARFQQLYNFFAQNLSNGHDIGASAAVFIDGEPVVDLWGGYVDKERTRPWQRDTIVNNFSTTKTMTALVALILADRGELDLNAPVTKYWPELHRMARALSRHACSSATRPLFQAGPRR